MLRLVLFLIGVIAAAMGLHWLADRPGNLTLEWQGYIVETSVFRAIVILALLLAVAMVALNTLRSLWRSPAIVGNIIHKRRERRGLEAISHGMIAIGSGDRALATRAALQARKSLPNEPLTHLLRAQTAQLQGDNTTARRMFEAMLATPDTELLGLRGLFLEATREGEIEAARQYAERALRANATLDWPADALFDIQCKLHDIDGALETLAIAKKNGTVERKVAERRRAVLLAGKAQDLEDDNQEQALQLALEAHGLAPELVPAAVIAGRILASRGQTPKAAKVLYKTWKLSAHPDIAYTYAHARIGDSPTDRLDRVRQLAQLNPMSAEGPLAIAEAAIEARKWDSARDALKPLLTPDRMTQRVATMMAKLEGAEHGDPGRVREWLARAVNAPRDPVWTAEGIVSQIWAPFSPSGRLDAFEWKVPVSELDDLGRDAITARTESLVALGAAASRPLVSPAAEASAAASSAPAEAAAPPASARADGTTTARPDDVEDAIEVPYTEPVRAAAKPAQQRTGTDGGPIPAMRESGTG